MSKNHDFLVIFGKNSAKNREKSPFFHEKCIFFAFFCKKKHSGVHPLFLQNLAPPRDPLFDSKAFGAKKKNKNKKFFFYFYLCLKKYFFYNIKKKIFFTKGLLEAGDQLRLAS